MTLLRNIYAQFSIRTSKNDQDNYFTILHVKRDYYRLDTDSLQKILHLENNGTAEYYGSLVYKDLVVVSDYFLQFDMSSLSAERAFIVFKGKKILGIIENKSFSNEKHNVFYFSVFMNSIRSYELSIVLETTLPEELGKFINEIRDKIIEKISDAPTPSLKRINRKHRPHFSKKQNESP